MKLRINQALYKLSLNSRVKLYKNKYKEVKYIFGSENKAIDLKSCIYAYDYANVGFKSYNKHGFYVESAYQNILYGIYEYIIEKYENPTLEEIFYTYCYIVRNGYLSIDGKFNFLYPEHEIEMRRGLSVMTGKSVCRNLGSMLSDLLTLFNIQAINILTDRMTTRSEEEDLCEGFYNLTSNIDEDNAFKKQYENLRTANKDLEECYGNHFEVIVYFNNKWYLLDPTSICLYDITSKDSGYPISDIIKLWSLYAMGEYDIKFTCGMYRIFHDKYIKIKNKDEDIDIQEKTYDDCHENQEKIKTLRLSVLDSIKYINDFLTTD